MDTTVLEHSQQSDQSSATDAEADPSQFLDLYGDYLYGFAYVRLRDSQLAEDVVQETLLKAIKNFSSFRGEAKVKTWLTTILRNEISTHFRKHNRGWKKLQLAESEESLEMGDLLHPQVSNSDFGTAIERERILGDDSGVLQTGS